MSDSILQLEHVSRFYGTVIGVGDLNLSLPSGAYGLVGPNGSGKTTLINLLTGILTPSLGRVRLFAADPSRDRHVLRRIGLCPASDILFPTITAHQWVSYLTSLHGIAHAEAQARAEAALTRLNMHESMHRPIGSYSLGMRQRTKLAQATAHEPDLLILDEPFNGLDPIGRHELTQFLHQWIRDGRSLILASHILHEVEAITRSFLLIHGGRILASGDASEVRSMLSDYPVEVHLRGRGLRSLAQALSQESWLLGLDLGHRDQSLHLRVSDRSAFQQRLVALAADELAPLVAIESVESPDGTLEAAFELLLKVHRGEFA